jgi:S1-C subfamily serine protease
MYDYPYRESHHAPRPSGPSSLKIIALLLPVLLFIVPVGLLAWHYWPLHSLGLNASAQLREVEARGPLYKNEMDLISLYEKALPSVVHINNLTDRSDGFSLNVQRVPRGSGSGFIWDKDGHIVTNYHVVQGASAVQVILSDRSTYDAKTVLVYPDKDLAVLSINAPKDKLVPIPLGSSHDLKVGQTAIVIGNPFGLDGTLTSGIVSALGREIESVTEHPIQNVIQTSAPINPGNSGGPLLDSDGRLIGVTTAILSPSGTFAGIGFAIPVDEVNTVVTQLIQKGKIDRPLLGVQMAESKQFNGPDGALITKVIPDSPAAQAGLRPTRKTRTGDLVLGDIIVALDQQPVQSTKDVFSFLEHHQPGDGVTVTILRDGARKDLQLTLAAAS